MAEKGKRPREDILDWHRLFGLMLWDFFTGSPFEVDLEKDLSLTQQFLDVVILRRTPGVMTEPLPDGLEDLVEHNLLSYKSLREPLDSWAIDELLGHLVNYRKQVSPSMNLLLPLEQFRLIGVSTRFPTKLENEVELEPKQPGVYEVRWGVHRVRILVLSEIPEGPQNAMWELFSGVPEKVAVGAQQYRPHREDINRVINSLFERYQLEGIAMSYTIEDFTRDYVRSHLDELTLDERLKGLSPGERLEGLSPEEVLSQFSPEERLRGLPPEERLRGLSLEERMQGLTPEQAEAYFRRMTQDSDEAQGN